MTTAIGLFRLDCFDKNKKEKKKSSLVPCGWWGREHHHDATPGVKIQHPTFPEQIFNRGKHSILAQ